MTPESVAERLDRIRDRIAAACARAGRSAEEVTLVAVTKGFGPDAIRAAVAAGVRDLGENRVQEAQAKQPELAGLPAEVRWHMIGHLQTNKVKAALDLFDIIQSVDSLHLAEAISRRALAPVPAFLEVNVAGENTTGGFALADLHAACETVSALPNIDVRGLMTVAPLVDDPEEVRPAFRALALAGRDLGRRELSMGMTNDFEVAIEEGATHVRIGRAIFGERTYA